MGKLVAAAALFVLPASVLVSCGGKASSGAGTGMEQTDAGGIDRTRLPAPIVVNAACRIVIDTPPLLASPHVPVGTSVTYSSNPPSSGPHYPIWAAYTAFTKPVDRRYYVHNLEHGGVVFAYRCADASGCPDVVAAFERAEAAIPEDPQCKGGGGNVRRRTVITPDPLLDVPIAVVAWGWTYKAECIDETSMRDFARAHYGQGTESTCANGQEQF